MADINTISADEFQEFIGSWDVTIVDVYADWCMPCQRMLRILPNMMDQLDGRAKIAKLNVDTMGDLKQVYQIKVVPTFLIFRRGELHKRFDGVTTLATLKQTLEDVASEVAQDDLADFQKRFMEGLKIPKQFLTENEENASKEESSK